MKLQIAPQLEGIMQDIFGRLRKIMIFSERERVARASESLLSPGCICLVLTLWDSSCGSPKLFVFRLVRPSGQTYLTSKTESCSTWSLIVRICYLVIAARSPSWYLRYRLVIYQNKTHARTHVQYDSSALVTLVAFMLYTHVCCKPYIYYEGQTPEHLDIPAGKAVISRLSVTSCLARSRGLLLAHLGSHLLEEHLCWTLVTTLAV
ncbi:hypothetical protein RRG08_042686 [Elysia crispata]|uniref:Uncharacterized protein n=1 Tax=Elysia crispata TaxID=231223 RepID=A0AAE1CK26_9GAST|nr:hypothetical protein RRG08_042686 [Elysia crispata]